MNSVMPTAMIEQAKDRIPNAELALRNLKLAKADIKNSTLNMSKTVKKNLMLTLMLSLKIKRRNR